jgi:hypothetical protein
MRGRLVEPGAEIVAEAKREEPAGHRADSSIHRDPIEDQGDQK